MQAISSCGEQGLLFVAVRWLLIEVASLVAEHRLESTGSVATVQGLSCSEECRICPEQGWNPCPLHWQVDSLPLSHQGSPAPLFLDCSPLVSSSPPFPD